MIKGCHNHKLLSRKISDTNSAHDKTKCTGDAVYVYYIVNVCNTYETHFHFEDIRQYIKDIGQQSLYPSLFIFVCLIRELR